MTEFTLHPRSVSHQPTGWITTLPRWQPGFRVVMMLALLTGLAGVAYGGIGRSGENPSPVAAGLIAQGTPETFLITCAIEGRSAKTTGQLERMSMSDWPAREYAPVAVADPAIGQAALDLYLDWYKCGQLGVASTKPVSAFDYENHYRAMRYFSDRYQFLWFLDTFPERAPSEVGKVQVFPQKELLQQVPLPLNRPLITEAMPVFGDVPVFAPGDVYALADGRYGVSIGTISTEQLQSAMSNGSESTNVSGAGVTLTWIAFVEEDGHLLIDEISSFCVSPSLATHGTPEATGTGGQLVGDCG